MAYTSLTHTVDDTTAIEAFDIQGHPGRVAVNIETGPFEVNLHGTHAELTRLATTLTGQLAQLAPDVAREAPADAEAAGAWDPITPDRNYLCSEYGGDPVCQVIPTWSHQTAVGRFSCDGHLRAKAEVA